MIYQSAEATEQLFKDKGGTLSLDIPESSYRVWADPDRLMQVMLNLLNNAVKFIPQDSGLVEVSIGEKPGVFRVSVKDNGPGIPKDKQPVIFEKFRQGEDGEAAPLGTGLGLPISRQIIEHFGGRLWVESSPGKGAIFLFELPRGTEAVS